MRSNSDIFWFDDNFQLLCRDLAMELHIVWKRIKKDHLDLAALNADRQQIYMHVQLADIENEDLREVLSMAGRYEKVIWIFKSIRTELRREMERNNSRPGSPANIYGYEMCEKETNGFDFKPAWGPRGPAV
jgi:hypothetical protein